MGVKMSKWIETEKGEFVNTDHVQIIRTSPKKAVIACIGDKTIELATYPTHDGANHCIERIIRSLKESPKTVTIKAKIEEV